MITVTPESPNSPEAQNLLEELSETLARLTGASGKASFEVQDVQGPRACFVIARTLQGEAVGCGAFRPLNETTAEIKRMFARPGTQRVGTVILHYLESQARSLGYSEVWLETRLVNDRAVSFYERRGYRRIPNFGKYVGNPQAVCFGKQLEPPPESPA